MTNTLALDIAVSTGWAGHLDDEVKHGTVDYREAAKRGLGCLGYHFHGWLADMVHTYDIETLFIERPFGHGTNADRLKGMVMIAHTVAYAHDVKVKEYAASQIRKALIGCSPKRTIAKKMIMAWAGEQGFNPANDDEADAIALLTYGLAEAVRV